MDKLTIEKMHELLTLAGYIFYDYDIANGVVRSLGAVEHVTGYTKEEFDSKDITFWTGLMHPEDRLKANEAQMKFLLDGGEYQGFYRIKKKDGEYVKVQDKGFSFKQETEALIPSRMIGLINLFTSEEYPK